MDLLESAFQKLRDVPENFDGSIATVVFDDSVDVLVYCCVLYVLLVFVVPEYVMKNRAPLNLRLPFILWNLTLCVFSILGAMSCVALLTFLVNDRGFYRTTCFFDKELIFNGKYAFWVFYFVLSKIPEMLDTAFLVFQKKPVIFLHWYHHLTVMLFCWHAHVTRISSGLWFATMNYCVHSIMYFYYFVCACGLRKIIRPIAPLITMLQILQMVVGTFIALYTCIQRLTHPRGCDTNDTSIRLGLMMYASYLFLFARFFVDRYYTSPSRSVKRVVNRAIALEMERAKSLKGA
ncbi:fatty acid elongase [Trypanosoma grayi]|uniref:fatty acid elongase n=1 Tax=Trypanosoma grayi TaxID=71804 RepID=UPI0004F440E2|nr:fatty acid elongase [Trypanosoma grayi]KEG06196.1 fatty acid elongase [Trypanosoma grayi]